MGEFDGLVSGDGVLMAGRFGPDWRVAETKSGGLFIEYPAALGVMGSFCAAVPSGWGCSRWQVAGRDGLVWCWRRWRGGGSGPLRSAS